MRQRNAIQMASHRRADCETGLAGFKLFDLELHRLIMCNQTSDVYRGSTLIT